MKSSKKVFRSKIGEDNFPDRNWEKTNIRVFDNNGIDVFYVVDIKIENSTLIFNEKQYQEMIIKLAIQGGFNYSLINKMLNTLNPNGTYIDDFLEITKEGEVVRHIKESRTTRIKIDGYLYEIR
jgi:hypothetical protein